MAKKEEKKEPEVQSLVPEIPEQPQVPSDYKPTFSRQQIELIKGTIAKGATDDELKMFMYVCQRTQLDPFAKQIHLVPRWDGKLGKEIKVPVVGIDGLRSVAERSGVYAGNTDAIFGEDVELAYNEKQGEKMVPKKMMVPSRATVTVKKAVAGVLGEFTATAEWTEYYPGDKMGFKWRQMPKTMLAKCAEAKALRKGFPMVMSGLYVPEEMHQAETVQVQEAKAYDVAKKLISGQTEVKVLEDYRKKISGSKKYSEPEKIDLAALVDQRLAELKKPETK